MTSALPNQLLKTPPWLESTGWRVAHGPDIAPDMPGAERQDHAEVVLATDAVRLPDSTPTSHRPLLEDPSANSQLSALGK